MLGLLEKQKTQQQQKNSDACYTVVVFVNAGVFSTAGWETRVVGFARREECNKSLMDGESAKVAESKTNEN